jgi:HEPN domain-containing protein
MNPLVAEWVAKAEGDYASAMREVRARKSPNYDSACFHTQQCIEKYLKGILQSKNIFLPRRTTFVRCSMRASKSIRFGMPFVPTLRHLRNTLLHSDTPNSVPTVIRRRRRLP